MTAKEYCRTVVGKASKLDGVKATVKNLPYKTGDYPLIRIGPKKTAKKDKVLMVTAGIHGEEIAGPLTILNHLEEIFHYAQKRKIKIILYPLVNPSGFEHGTRYNADNDRGEFGNNDFCRYITSDGKILDDLADNKNFVTFKWSSVISDKLPLETRMLQKRLREDPLDQIVAIIDLHQDYLTDDGQAAPFAYHYAFGDLEKYRGIVEEIEKLLPISKNTSIGAGQRGSMKTDTDGFIVRHDGSLASLFNLLGAKHSVTVETMGKTPLETAIKVNLIWIKGIIDIINKI